MAFATNLVFNVSTGALVLSANQPSNVANPVWFYGDTKHLVITFVQNADLSGTVSIMPATGIGLQIGAGTPGGTVLTTATSAPAVGDVYTVDLPMNTSAINTALTAAGGVALNTTFEFKTSDGTYTQRYEIPLVIRAAVLTDVVTDVPPPDVAIGGNAVRATYVPKVWAAGDFMIMTDTNGIQYRFFAGTDGSAHLEAI